MKYVLFILASLLCGCTNTIDETLVASNTGKPLYQLHNTHFDRFVVHSRKDFKQFNRLILFNMNVEKLIVSPSTDTDINRSWQQAKTEDVFAIAEQFDELARFIFDKGKAFEYTHTGGEDVLAVEFRLMRYDPLVSKNGAWDNPTSMDRYISSFGQAHIQVVLANSKTGELVAVIEDALNLNLGIAARSFSTDAAMGSTNSRQNQKAAWRRAFKIWLSNLREDLERLKQQA
ncbi:hypothetical protein [Neptunicella sp. SCSIO 80796]|uniref:hypothetical protein n=1 Tax=Neptunicella plasticusilytica TaxID=3117012 RepID=UPI003A4D71CC